MKIDATVNSTLNGLLRHELTLINQYFLHARLMKHFGYAALGKIVYKQSIAAMKHADSLIERIYLLEGLPNLQDLGKLKIGESVAEALECDWQSAQAQHRDLQSAIAELEAQQDYVSRELAEALLDDNEEYIDWLETQRELINSLGLQNYLQYAVADAKREKVETV